MESNKRSSDNVLKKKEQKINGYRHIRQTNPYFYNHPLIKDQDSQIIYYPIETDSDNIQTIYLSSKDKNNNVNYKITDGFNYIPKKPKIDLSILPQRCVEFHIKDKKNEDSFISSSNNNGNNNSTDNIHKKSNNYKESEYNTKVNYNNKKQRENNFELKSKNNENYILNLSYLCPVVNRSTYVDNNSKILNNSYTGGSIYAEDVIDSKIFNENFIAGIKNPKRKKELLKSLEKFRKIKSLSRKYSPINRSYSLTNIYQINFQPNEKIINNNIVEEENENENNNSENENKVDSDRNFMNKTFNHHNKLSGGIPNSKIIEKIKKNRIINIYENNVKNLKTNKSQISSPNSSKDGFSSNENEKQYTKILILKQNEGNTNVPQKKKSINKIKNIQIEKSNKKIIRPEHYSPQTLYTRKLIREERFYIDDQGKEKIVQVFQSPISKKEIVVNGNNNILGGNFEVVKIRNTKYINSNDQKYFTQKKKTKINDGNIIMSPKICNNKIDNIKILVPKKSNNINYQNIQNYNKLCIQKKYNNRQFLPHKITKKDTKKYVSNNNVKKPVITQNNQNNSPNYKNTNNNGSGIYFLSVSPRNNSNSGNNTFRSNHSFHEIKSNSNNRNIVINNKNENIYDSIYNNQINSLSPYSNNNNNVNSYRNYTRNNIVQKEQYQPLYTARPYIGNAKNIIIVANKINNCKNKESNQFNSYHSGDKNKTKIYNNKPITSNKSNSNIFHMENRKHDFNPNTYRRNDLKLNDNCNSHLYVETRYNGNMDNYNEKKSFNSNSKKNFTNNGNINKINTNMYKTVKFNIGKFYIENDYSRKEFGY